MAGFREFVTGEVLTAANVDDFLAKQSVMKFADAAARDAALGTAVVSPNALREGMVAWLDDDDELQAYDGTAWATVGEALEVSAVYQTADFTTTSGTLVPITDFEITVTPRSVDSVFFVTANVIVNPGTNFFVLSTCALLRDATGIAEAAQESIGDSRRDTLVLSRKDEPATTSPVTYLVQTRLDSGSTLRITNRNLTVIEVF